MPKFLVLHTMDPKAFGTDPNYTFAKAVVALNEASKDAKCITTWVAAGAGKLACEWEGSSEQAVIDTLAQAKAQGVDIPVDGIYPTQVFVWAEVAKQLAGG